MQQIVNIPSIARAAVAISPMLQRGIFVFVVLVIIAVSTESAADAAPVATTVQRIAGAASTEFTRLLGLLGIFLAVGLVLAIDRRRRIRTRRLTA